MTAQEFDRLVTKFHMETKQGRHVRAEFFYQERKILSTHRSHGKKDNPGDKIAKQLSLSQPQLREAISCTLSLEDYIAILRDKGLLSN